MRRWWKWTKRITLFTLAFLVFAVAVTVGVLHTDWGRNRLRNVVVDQLQSTFPGSTIGRIDGSVFGDLILRDVVIMAKDKKPLATIETLVVSAAIQPLIGKTVHVESVVADGVVVFVRPQPEEPSKPAAKPSAASEPSAWSIELPLIELRRGKVVLEERGEVIDELAARASLTLRSGEPMLAGVLATARYRGEPIAVNATVSYGDVLELPYAFVSLGAARVVVTKTSIDGTAIAGTVSAFAPAALVEKLAEVKLPGDVAIGAKRLATGGTQVVGLLGDARVTVLGTTDLDKLSAKAVVTAEAPDLALLTEGKVTGAGTVAAAIVGDENHLDGMVSVVGEAEGYAGRMVVALSSTLDKARVVAAGRGVGWQIGASADLTRAGDAWTLAGSEVVAHVRDIAPLRGEAIATINAHGPLSPEPSLAVHGTVDGKRIRYDDVSVARVRTRFAATNIPAKPTGTASIEATGVRQGTLAIPVATLSARGGMDEAGVIDIDFERHRVRTADGVVWGGSGGHVRVTEQSIAVTKLATASGKSRITAQATLGRTSDALTAKVTARDVPVGMLDPELKGTLAADVDVSRTGGLWKGTASVDAKQVVLPNRPVFDGKVAVKIDKRRVTARLTASNQAIGSATVDVDVIGPRDITDGRAWQRLERSAIQGVRVALAKIDASKLGASGSLDGELAISASTAGGKVDVRGVVTELGTIDSQLALGAADKGEIVASGTLHLGGVDPVEVRATLALPLHPFDPNGWEHLGRATLREATIEAKRIAFDPDLLQRFGVKDSPWRGWAATKIHIGPGARTSEFVIDVHELRDGPLTKPVEIHIAGGSDAYGIRAEAKLATDKVAVELKAKSPITVEAILEGRARTAPIEATLSVPKVAARDVALLIDRGDVIGGTVAGTITVGGTIEKPTGRAQLSAENLAVQAGLTSKPPTLEKMDLDARWHGDRFELELTGFETGGRLLKISARGQPDSPDTVVASIEAANFDIQPFMAFAPPGSPLVAARGLVSGVLKLRGLDPNTGDVRGRLIITKARIPIAPELGTLRDGTFEINVVKKEIVALIDAKLGKGKLSGKAVARLTGSMPTAAELTLAIRNVSPIGELQPIINADVAGYFVRTRTKWTGKITVKNGDIFVPPEGGNELLGTGAPSDIVFIDAQPVLIKPKRKPPTKPWLIADVEIGRTKIKVDEVDFGFEALASGNLKLALGDGIGLDGAIVTERGHAEIVARRYRLERGVVDFDGTLDPRLDIRLQHNFKSMTLTVDVIGRSSAPDLRLSSDIGAYSQGQLFGFLLGGTPGDDPSSGGAGDAVAGGSLGLLSQRLGRRISKRLPVLKLDVINYEAKTASSSRAIKVGKRIGERTYLLFRQRFEARPDENSQEVTLEHELRDNLIIEGGAGDVGAGADLLWRKRW